MSLPLDLTDERRNRGLSKRAAAESCGIGYASWCRAENGEALSPGTQKAIADWLGRSVTEAFPEEATA